MRTARQTRRPSRAHWWMLAALVAGLFGYLWLGWRRTDKDLRDTRAWARTVLDSLDRTLTLPGPPVGPQGRDSVYWQWVATSAEMASRRAKEEIGFWKERRGTLLSETDLEALRAEGLEDPARQLRDSLLADPDIVPFQRRNQPRMRLLRDRVVLLRRPFVFASFENGRTRGHMLVEYRIAPGPRVRWRRLWAEQAEED